MSRKVGFPKLAYGKTRILIVSSGGHLGLRRAAAPQTRPLQVIEKKAKVRMSQDAGGKNMDAIFEMLGNGILKAFCLLLCVVILEDC